VGGQVDVVCTFEALLTEAGVDSTQLPFAWHLPSHACPLQTPREPQPAPSASYRGWHGAPPSFQRVALACLPHGQLRVSRGGGPERSSGRPTSVFVLAADAYGCLVRRRDGDLIKAGSLQSLDGSRIFGPCACVDTGRLAQIHMRGLASSLLGVPHSALDLDDDRAQPALVSAWQPAPAPHWAVGWVDRAQGGTLSTSGRWGNLAANPARPCAPAPGQLRVSRGGSRERGSLRPPHFSSRVSG